MRQLVDEAILEEVIYGLNRGQACQDLYACGVEQDSDPFFAWKNHCATTVLDSFDSCAEAGCYSRHATSGKNAKSRILKLDEAFESLHLVEICTEEEVEILPSMIAYANPVFCMMVPRKMAPNPLWHFY